MRKFLPREINWLRKFAKPDSWLEVSQTSIPVEYITGFAEFCGREFKVTPDVLIPRIETEELVVHSIKLVTSLDKSEIMVADIGTGCGCIGITLYLELIKLGFRPTVYLSDISKKALKVAEENINVIPSERSKSRDSAKRSIITIRSDLFSGYPQNLKFDLIIANLPYVPSGRWRKLPESVRKFEPKSAIDGGKDGALLIKKLIKQSRKRLFSGGAMILEIDESHSERTFEREIGKDFKAELKQDQFGKNRFMVLHSKSVIPSVVEESRSP